MMNATSVNKKSSGFTLLELLVAIAVAAILLTVATPSVRKILKDNQVSSQTNEVIALVNLTRNEAIRRGIDANDDEEAILRIDASGSGWTGNVSVTAAETTEGCPAGVIRCSSNTDVSLTTTALNGELSFESRGYLRKADWSEETVCLKYANDCTGNRQHTRITILPSGQVQTESLACDTTC